MILDSKSTATCRRAVGPAAFALLVALTMAACGDATGPGVTGPTITIEPVADSVFEGDTVRLTARVFDEAGGEVVGAPVTWEIGDTTLAGLVESDLIVLRRPGTVRITARSGTASADLDLLIGRLVVQRVELTPDAVVIGRTDHLAITARVVAQGGREVTGRAVSFTSDDTLVAVAFGAPASDDPAGALVIGVGAGSTTIRATAEGVTGSAAVGVVTADTTFSLTRYDGSPTPVLVEADSVATGGAPLIYEIYADSGQLVLSGLLQRRYQVDVTYAVYRLAPDTDPVERVFVARIRGQSDRGLVSTNADGSLSLVSEIIGPHLEHTATPGPDGYLVRFSVPGESTELDLGYSRDQEPAAGMAQSR